jgi:hypothetical protein
MTMKLSPKGWALALLPALFVLLLWQGLAGWTGKQQAHAGQTLALSDTISTSPQPAHQLFKKLGLAKTALSPEVFEKALQGYERLSQSGKLKKQLLAIADLSVASGQKRLYLVDLKQQRLLVHTYVAHGRNSGDRMATRFSNTHKSLQSSLGFFVTGETYTGSNGYSMRLEGMEKNINDQARDRAIVMHGAAYVNAKLAQSTGRIGRSWGCPAVSLEERKTIIDLLKQGSCLFIFAPQPGYLAGSPLLNQGSL